MLSESFCLLSNIASSWFSQESLTAVALVCPVPDAAALVFFVAVFFLFFGDFYVLVILHFAVCIFSDLYAVLGTSANRSANPQIADSRFWFADLRTGFLTANFCGFTVKTLKSTANSQINNIAGIVFLQIPKIYVFTIPCIDRFRWMYS